MPNTKDFTDYVKKYGLMKTFNLINKWQRERQNQLQKLE
jgi:hypothetical protein